MSEDGGYGGGYSYVVVAGCQVLRDADGEEGFAEIEQERGEAESFGSGASDVGGADVAAAGGADVLFAEDSHEKVAERDGA